MDWDLDLSVRVVRFRKDLTEWTMDGSILDSLLIRLSLFTRDVYLERVLSSFYLDSLARINNKGLSGWSFSWN